MNKSQLLASAATLFGLVWASEAYAQAAAGPAELEEVIVTAERSAQNVQDVSQSVVAITGADLAARGVVDAGGLAGLVPGLVVKQGRTPSVFIRGVGNSGTSNTADQGVALHIDGVFMSRQSALRAGFFDLDRVEVAVVTAISTTTGVKTCTFSRRALSACRSARGSRGEARAIKGGA